MITAVALSMIVMLVFVNQIGAFVERHPTIKMLALAFLILIGTMLVAEGFHQHIPRAISTSPWHFPSSQVAQHAHSVRRKVKLHQPYRWFGLLPSRTLSELQSNEALRREEFPVTADRTVSPTPRCAAAHAESPMPSMPGRFREPWMIRRRDFRRLIFRTRRLIAGILHAQPGEVAFVGPTSLALSFVAAGLPWKRPEHPRLSRRLSVQRLSMDGPGGSRRGGPVPQRSGTGTGAPSLMFRDRWMKTPGSSHWRSRYFYFRMAH